LEGRTGRVEEGVALLRQALALAPDDERTDGRGRGTVDERLARLAAPHQGLWPAEGAIRLLVLVLAALIVASICVSFHASAIWLGVLTCAAAVAGFASLLRPLFAGPGADPGLTRQRMEEARDAG
jgi:hypothetical protein